MFDYQAGRNSFWNRVDPRIKIVLLLGFSYAILVSGWVGLVLLTSAQLLTFTLTGVSPSRPLVSILKAWPLLLFLVGLPFLQDQRWEILPELFLKFFKLVQMILTGHLFSLISQPSEIRGTLQWILKPLHKGLAFHAGTMAGLVFTFIPQLFRQLESIQQVALSRSLRPGRNPLRWLRIMTLPLLSRAFVRSFTMAWAMECRLYGVTQYFLPLPRLRSQVPLLLAIVGVSGLLGWTLALLP